jgi:hypothetical protein
MRRFGRFGKRSVVLLSVMLMLAFSASVAFASGGSPHFIGTPTCTKSLSTGLTCSGKAAGLDDSVITAFLTASSVTATFECVNHGGNVAPGQPVVVQNVTGPTETIAPHNGQITFTVTLPPPPTPSAAVDCPNGNWTVRITSLTFTDVVLHLQQQGMDVLTFDFGTIDP